MFDRKKYMKEYYLKNQEKLKSYSAEYKRKKKGLPTKPIKAKVKNGDFLITFD